MDTQKNTTSSNNRQEVINPLNPDDEHVIVYRDGVMKFYLPRSCSEQILLCVLAELETDFSLKIMKKVQNNSR